MPQTDPSAHRLDLWEATDARPAYAALPPAREGADVPALYVHVPFCTTKCHYCDFYSVAGHLEEADAYLESLGEEIRLQTAHFGKPAPETIFIGGGTPTLLDARRLERLLELIEGGIRPGRLREFTVEANPNTFCADRARVLQAHGVTRISFGAQSFVAEELKALQRDHDPANVEQAIEIAGAAGLENYNLDLIFGTPGQTPERWAYSLTRALALAPSHLSCYSLTYEPNTPMTARMKRGEFAPLDEEVELAIFQQTYDTLRSAGMERYEISNYARPGKACRHNLHYWKGSNYLAWGPAAAAGYQGYHWKNVQSLRHYVAALRPGNASRPALPLVQMEQLAPARRAGELLMLWMRLAEGVNYAEFVARTGVDARPRLTGVLKKYDGLGFLEASDRGVKLTDRGVPVSDALLREMLREFA